MVQAIVHIDGIETTDQVSGVPCINSASRHEAPVMSGIGQSISIGPLAARQPTPPEGGFSIGLEIKNPLAGPNEVTNQYLYGSISNSDDTIQWSLEKIAFGGKLHTVQALYGSPKPSTLEGEECVICLTLQKSVAILHCRHVCLCKDCATITSSTWSYQCPVCRGPVSAMCAMADEV